MKKLFTIRQAAQYTGLSPNTLYSWVWQKKIPYVKLGKAVRFDIADLDKFIELHRIEPEGKLSSYEEPPQKRG